MTTALDEARERFRERFEDAGIVHRAKEFLDLARPAVFFRPAPAIFEGDIPLGASKIGGKPDLPAAYPWPEDLRVPGSVLSFLVQINLSEVPRGVLDIDLPSDGLLSVLAHPEEFDIGRLLWRPPGPVARRDPPEEARSWPVRRLDGVVEMTLDTQRRDFPRLDGDDERPYHVLEQREDEQIVQLGGDPYIIQCPMEETCDQIAGDAERLEGEAARWLHILQIGSIDAVEMKWGDGGSLYVWLRAGDFATRQFGSAVVTMQCY